MVHMRRGAQRDKNDRPLRRQCQDHWHTHKDHMEPGNRSNRTSGICWRRSEFRLLKLLEHEHGHIHIFRLTDYFYHSASPQFLEQVQTHRLKRPLPGVCAQLQHIGLQRDLGEAKPKVEGHSLRVVAGGLRLAIRRCGGDGLRRLVSMWPVGSL